MNIEPALKKIAKGAGIVFLGMGFGKLIGYLYVMLVARLGSSEYGLLSLGFAIISFLTTLSLLGLDFGILRYVSYYKGLGDKERMKGAIIFSLKICVPLGILFSILLFVLADKISVRFFHTAELIPILKIFAFIIPFFVMKSIFLVSLRAFQRAEYEIGVKDIIEKFVKVVLTFILIYLGYKVLGAAVAYVLSTIIAFGLAFYILQKKVFPVFDHEIKSTHYRKELLAFSVPLMFSALLTTVITWIDILMVGYFRTTSEVGILNVALPTASVMFVIPFALDYLFRPIISEKYGQRKIKEIKALYRRTAKWVFFANFPIFLLFILFARPILRILFGNEYISGALALTILVVGYMIYSLEYISSAILEMIKKTRLIFFIIFGLSIANIILNYLLIPKYGIFGGALATSFAYAMGSVLMIIHSYKHIRVQPFAMNFFKAIFAGLISLVIINYLIKWIFVVVPLYGLIIAFVLFIVLYLGLLVLFKSFDEEDIKIIKAVLRKLQLINN